MKLQDILFEGDLYSEINDAASAIGTIRDLTHNVRKRTMHHIDAGLNKLNDADLKELLRKADSEEKFALRIAMKVMGRRDPSE